jgi:hypothetical protein
MVIESCIFGIVGACGVGFDPFTMIIKFIRRSTSGLIALGFAFLLSACYETKQEFTLNADGSGKVRHECTFQNVNLGGNSENDTSEEALQAAIAKIISSSKGVDAWTDVSFKRLEDNKMWFRGTAYFKKLDELEIPNQSMLQFAWKNQGGGKAELALNLKKSENPTPKKADDATLTAEQRAKKIKDERAKFQQSKPMFSAILGGLKQSVSFKLPGKIESSSNFKPTSPGVLGLDFEGAKMIDALEKLVNDDAWLAKNGFDAQASPEMDSELSGLLFGEKAPVKATVSGASTPLFDYAAEVATALKGVEALQKKLGAVSIAPPAKGEALKSIKVVGVRMVSAVDKKLEVRPFNYDEGYTLAVLAELPGSVLDVTDKSKITSATASDGSSLLKGERDWDRRLGFPELSADKASVMFTVELQRPAPSITGIKEISGTLQYRVSGGVKEIDLGLESLKAGAKGTELAASIEGYKEGWQKDGSQDMQLKLRLDPDNLKAAYLVVDGVRTEIRRSGYSGMNGQTTFTFESKTAFPEKGSIVVVLYDQVQTFEVPFKIENLSLLGTPLDAAK